MSVHRWACLRTRAGPGRIAEDTARRSADLVSMVLRRPPVMIPPRRAPARSVALMNAPDALPGYEALLPPESTFRNEVAARFASRTTYRPGRAAKKVKFPILFCVSNTDTRHTHRSRRCATRAQHPWARSNATTPGTSTSTSASRSKHWCATRPNSSPATCSRWDGLHDLLLRYRTFAPRRIPTGPRYPTARCR